MGKYDPYHTTHYSNEVSNHQADTLPTTSFSFKQDIGLLQLTTKSILRSLLELKSLEKTKAV